MLRGNKFQNCWIYGNPEEYSFKCDKYSPIGIYDSGKTLKEEEKMLLLS